MWRTAASGVANRYYCGAITPSIFAFGGSVVLFNNTFFMKSRFKSLISINRSSIVNLHIQFYYFYKISHLINNVCRSLYDCRSHQVIGVLSILSYYLQVITFEQSFNTISLQLCRLQIAACHRVRHWVDTKILANCSSNALRLFSVIIVLNTRAPMMTTTNMRTRVDLEFSGDERAK